MNQSYLKECLDYDQFTGNFVWKDRPKNHFLSEKAYKIFKRLYAHKPCGTKAKDGYMSITIDGKVYKAHRLAWLYQMGEFPIQWLDHINRNRSDNRICNLRLATPTLNAQNANMRYDNKSGVVGVSKHKLTGKWVAQISVSGKVKHLGLFTNINDATKIRDAAVVKFRSVAP
jgi:hypothetical protein